MRTPPGRHVLAALATVLLSSAWSGAEAKTLVVAVTGSDNGGCGGKATPCRSISQAVANAAPGDKIVVGPGRYGDVDGDGILGEPGEEAAAASALVTVTKPLAIESRDGAAATIIDAGGTTANHVRIVANGVRFGKPKKGFTLQNAPSGSGVTVEVSPGNDVVVAGNRSVGNRNGFRSVAQGMLFTGNQAIGNTDAGFLLWSAGTRLVGNEAIGNENGVEAESDGRNAQIIGNTIVRNSLAGIKIDGKEGAVITGNIVSGNLAEGIRLDADDALVSGNVVNGNVDAGVYANGTRITITKNTAYANVGPGVVVTSPSQDVTVTGNNLAGNDRESNGCGIFKFTDDAVDATGNFWGTSTGPGPTPADQACDDTSADNLATTPFAPKEIKVKPKPPKIG